MSKNNNKQQQQAQVAYKLTAKELQEYQEAFSYFDAGKQGFIQTSDVGNVMRSVGLNPSESELDTILKNAQKVCASPSRGLDFNEFIALTSKSIAESRVSEHQIREAFKIFDTYGNGLVNLMQMRVSLQNLGERLRDEEIDELIREADIDTDGNVNYDELVKILCKN